VSIVANANRQNSTQGMRGGSLQVTAHGDYTHVEIPADDPDRAQRFYGGVFGWSFQSMEGYPDYFLFTTPAGEKAVGGAIGKRDVTAPHEIRTYINVDSVDDSVRTVGEQGGRVIEPKAEVPGQGWYAVVADTEGNVFALWESAPG
jgi:predicted enzyme related to lactoylglutathione lyase